MKFRMVDNIIAYDPGRSICGTKVVSFEEYQLKSAFAGQPALPESLIMEALFQLGNWLIMLTSDFSRMGLVVRFQRVEFLHSLTPVHSMLMEVRVRRYREDGILFEGEARTGQQTVVRGQRCMAIPVDLATYCDPADLRVLFSEIYRPLKDARG